MITTSSTYDKAVKIVNENPNLVDDFGGASDEIIDHAQMVLGLEFPQAYKHFLSQYGALTFGSTEIYGVFQKDFEKSGVPEDAQENEVIFNSFEDFFLDMVVEEIGER